MNQQLLQTTPVTVLEKYLALALHVSSLTPKANTLYPVPRNRLTVVAKRRAGIDTLAGTFDAANAPPRAYRVPRLCVAARALRLWRSNSPRSGFTAQPLVLPDDLR